MAETEGVVAVSDPAWPNALLVEEGQLEDIINYLNSSKEEINSQSTYDYIKQNCLTVIDLEDKKTNLNIQVMPLNDLFIPEDGCESEAYSCCFRCSLGFLDYSDQPSKGYSHVLVYQDDLTKFTILKPLKEKKDNEIIHCLLEIFSLIGVPAKIYATEKSLLDSLTTKDVGSFCQNFSTKIKHPKCQDFEDKECRRIDELLKKWMRLNNSSEWTFGLFIVQFQNNCCFNNDIQAAPFNVLLKPNYTYTKKKYTRYLVEKRDKNTRKSTEQKEANDVTTMRNADEKTEYKSQGTETQQEIEPNVLLRKKYDGIKCNYFEDDCNKEKENKQSIENIMEEKPQRKKMKNELIEIMEGWSSQHKNEVVIQSKENLKEKHKQQIKLLENIQPEEKGMTSQEMVHKESEPVGNSWVDGAKTVEKSEIVLATNPSQTITKKEEDDWGGALYKHDLEQLSGNTTIDLLNQPEGVTQDEGEILNRPKSEQKGKELLKLVIEPKVWQELTESHSNEVELSLPLTENGYELEKLSEDLTENGYELIGGLEDSKCELFEECVDSIANSQEFVEVCKQSTDNECEQFEESKELLGNHFRPVYEFKAVLENECKLSEGFEEVMENECQPMEQDAEVLANECTHEDEGSELSNTPMKHEMVMNKIARIGSAKLDQVLDSEKHGEQSTKLSETIKLLKSVPVERASPLKLELVPLHKNKSKVYLKVIPKIDCCVDWYECDMKPLVANERSPVCSRIKEADSLEQKYCLVCKKKKRIKPQLKAADRCCYEAGSTVRVRVPIKERKRGYPNCILAVVMEQLANGEYKVATPCGILKESFKKDQLSPCNCRMFKAGESPRMEEIETREALSWQMYSPGRG